MKTPLSERLASVLVTVFWIIIFIIVILGIPFIYSVVWYEVLKLRYERSRPEYIWTLLKN